MHRMAGSPPSLVGARRKRVFRTVEPELDGLPMRRPGAPTAEGLRGRVAAGCGVEDGRLVLITGAPPAQPA